MNDTDEKGPAATGPISESEFRKESRTSTGQSMRNSGAATIRAQADVLDISYRMRRDLLRVKMKPQARLALEVLLLETFDSGRLSVFVPDPQNVLARLVQIQDGDFFRHIAAVERAGIISRKLSAGGTEYILNPDCAFWRGAEWISDQNEADQLRAILLRAPRQAEMVFDTDVESLDVVMARLGIDNSMAEGRPRLEIPTSMPSDRGIGETQRVGDSNFGRVAQGGTESVADGISVPFKGSKITQSSSKALRAKDPAEREFLERLNDAIGLDGMENDGGKWRNDFRDYRLRPFALSALGELESMLREGKKITKGRPEAMEHLFQQFGGPASRAEFRRTRKTIPVAK